MNGVMLCDRRSRTWASDGNAPYMANVRRSVASTLL